MAQKLPPTCISMVGPETLDNLQLVNTLLQFVDEDLLYRQLGLNHMREFAVRSTERPLVFILDLLAYDPVEASNAIGEIRLNYPNAVFVIYVDKADYEQKRWEFPGRWPQRLGHYVKLFKEAPDVELLPIVKMDIEIALLETERSFRRSLAQTSTFSAEEPAAPTDETPSTSVQQGQIFVSYSRADWDVFVHDLVNQLNERGFSLWIDQHLLVGGDDWVDAIGEALEQANVLMLIMSPDALQSRYVKMEYRYFFNHDKPIIPILYRPVKDIPLELTTTQYIDFTNDTRGKAYEQLFYALSRYVNPTLK